MFRITEYKIASEKVPKSFHGYRIVQLSDLHGAVYGDDNRDLIAAVRKAKPDVVVMTGDMMDSGKGAAELAVNLCCRIGQEFLALYIFGNHEQTLEKNTWQNAALRIRESGVQILDNEWIELQRGTDRIRFYGLTMPLVYYKDPFGEYEKGINFYKQDVQKALGPAVPGKFNVLLAHNPLYYPAYYNWGADLTLSGHVHGGVINIPGIGGLLSPDMTFFPKYDAGHFERNGRHLIVSRGLGNRFLFRVNNPPEVVVLTLEHKD